MKLTKEQIMGIVGGIVVVIAIIISGLFIADRTRPNNNDETRFGTHNIQINLNEWSPNQRQALEAGRQELTRLGPNFRFVESGETFIARVRVDNTIGCNQTHTAGEWQPVFRTIAINPTCIQGDLQLQRTLTHEVGHALGMRHIPRNISDQPMIGEEFGRGYGIAIMNPMLTYIDDNTTNVEVSNLDIDEYMASRQHR